MKNETTQPFATEQAIAKIEFTDAKAFESIVAAINGLADKYRGLQITDTDSYKVVVRGIAEMRNLRISVEARRREKKADILTAGRQIDDGAKQITKLLLPIENDLKATKQAEDAKKEAIRIEKEKAEQKRIESIQSKIAAFPPDMSKLPQLLKMTAPEIQEMQDVLTAVEIDVEIYQEFTPDAIKAKVDKTGLLKEYYIARIQTDATEARQKAEAERQEQIRKDQEVQRIEQEKALEKQEEEQKAKQKIEDNRLAKIREEQKIEADKLLAEQERIEADKQALKEERDRLENERLERERIERERLAQIERDRLTKIEAERQEKARIEKEAQEKATREKTEAEEKARQEALRPDREKIRMYIKALVTAIAAVEKPIMSTNGGGDILIYLSSMIKKTITYATEQVDM